MSDFEPIRFGKYQLIEKIATGGMAEVYKAKSYGVAGFEKLLVIKKILPHLSRNKDFVAMFINEAKIAVSLNHANIVQVYDLGVVGADYYMAMEFIHGHDLMKIIKKGRKTRKFLPIPTSVYIISEVARGLDYAHNLSDPGGRPLNVVHQDVSPHNVLLSFEGDVKVVDFGIARVGEVAEEEAGKMAGGKFAYMAPEQARGGMVDHRSDIFATCIILYELITGQRLYAGKDRNEKMRMVRNAEIPPPRAVNPEIPARLEEILLRGLARDPDQRFQSALELQEELLSFLYDVGMRVTRADLSAFMKDMFAEEYARQSAGSVVNAIVQDLSELSKQPGIAPADLVHDAVEKGAEPGGDALESGEWNGAELSISVSGLAGTPSIGSRIAQGDRRQVEVLAIEITGITDLADRVGEEELLKLNFSFLKSLATVIKKYQGQITRHDADRLLVMWGLEQNTPKDLELCIRCAADMRRISEKFAEVRGERVQLSMGIHRGAVLVAAKAGKKKRRGRRSFTPWGDTVKLARRLCDEAGLDDVLVSEKVFGLLGEHGEFDPLGEVPVKWRVGKVRMYRLRRLRGRGERGQVGGWVKRGDEFEVLREIIAKVAGGKAAVLSVEGDTGSGKARFVREIREITREREIALYSGRGSFYQRETPFLAFREVLESICGFEDNESDDERRTKLQRLTELRLDPIDIHIIGELFELSFPGSNLKYLSGDQKRIGTFEAIRKIFSGLLSDGFLVLALENFNFLDHYSADLAAHLVRTLSDQRLLLVLTHSKDGVLPFPEEAEVHRLPLPPMGEEEVRQFVREMLGAADVPEELQRQVYDASGGNALFVKEIVGQLRRQGLVKVEDGAAKITGDIGQASIPATVEDLIASRIDSLSPSERVVLEVAATIGRSFDSNLLAEVTRLGRDELSEVLAKLKALKLVRLLRDDEQAGDADHTFRNELCWEVSTRGILASRSKEFHNRVGESLERLYSGNLRPWYEVLSRHYQSGGLLRRAATFAEQAGVAYEKGYFNREALRCYQRAILLLRGSEADHVEGRSIDAHLAELYLRLGRVQARNLQTNEADRSFSKALDFSQEAGENALIAESLVQMGRIATQMGNQERAGDYLKRAQEIAEELDDPELMSDADEELAQWALEQGDFDMARAALNRALKTAREREDRGRIAGILGSLGSYYMRAGDYALSERHLRKAHELARATEDKILQGKLLNNLGVTYIHMERFGEALACYREACEIRKGIEYRRGVIVNLHNIGDVYFRMGDYARAYQYFEESLDAAEANDWSGGRAMNMVYLGYLRALRGELDEGEAALLAGIEEAEHHGDRETESQGKVFLARVLTRRGEVERAREVLLEANAGGHVPSGPLSGTVG